MGCKRPAMAAARERCGSGGAGIRLHLYKHLWFALLKPARMTHTRITATPGARRPVTPGS